MGFICFAKLTFLFVLVKNLAENIVCSYCITFQSIKPFPLLSSSTASPITLRLSALNGS